MNGYRWFGEIFCLFLEKNYIALKLEAGDSSENLLSCKGLFDVKTQKATIEIKFCRVVAVDKNEIGFYNKKF
jgi:hypothetical protein